MGVGKKSSCYRQKDYSQPGRIWVKRREKTLTFLDKEFPLLIYIYILTYIQPSMFNREGKTDYIERDMRYRRDITDILFIIILRLVYSKI